MRPCSGFRIIDYSLMLLNVNIAGNRTEGKRNLRKSCDVEIRAGVAEPGQRRRAPTVRDCFRSLSRRGSWVRIPPPAPCLLVQKSLFSNDLLDVCYVLGYLQTAQVLSYIISDGEISNVYFSSFQIYPEICRIPFVVPEVL
jgi:hypothetical protein